MAGMCIQLHDCGQLAHLMTASVQQDQGWFYTVAETCCDAWHRGKVHEIMSHLALLTSPSNNPFPAEVVTRSVVTRQ